jgi:sigma-54 specific flagellar transcriptional regulator A
VRRVGDNTPSYINVRVLAATNEPLEKKMKDGSFREDLYYRLNVIPINLPAVRERLEDVPLLVAHFLRNRINPRSGHPVQITRQAMEALSRHDWPGNVRELENAIERSATLCEGNVIQLTDLPANVSQNAAPSADAGELAQLPTPHPAIKTLFPADATTIPASVTASPAGTPPLAPSAPVNSDLPLKDFLREQEVAYLNRVMAMMGGDKEKAAIHLGISLATLYRKLSEDERTA